ncbi:MAG: hypothetical protein EPO26_02580 [Chloroflexota bacterium]|nr:MAG: hypothetical protein EPO26_02580 [Chloroflexota bacterium]
MEIARDIAIILLAIINIVWLLILCAIGFIVWRLFVQFRDRVPALLDAVSDILATGKSIAETGKATAISVKGTADFVGDVAVSPAIRVGSLSAAIAKFFAVLLGGSRSRS